MRRGICGFWATITITSLVVGSTGADEPPVTARSRKDFAAAMSRVTVGMPEAAVLSLLGKPDDIRTEHDAGGIQTARTREIWRYGTSGHLTPATLGKVYIDEQGRAQYIYGNGDPRADESFTEEELQQLLQVLARVPSYNAGTNYNPLKVIRAVNALQPLGKKRALSVIDEHLRVTSYFDDESREGVFLVLRTLFDVPSPPGYMPEMRVGAPYPAAPDDKQLLPRFPITLEEDIPFKLVTGYSLAGEPEPPERHLEYFREHGVLRARPLSPSATPFATLDALAQSNRWLFKVQGDDERGRLYLAEQIVRMFDSVYRLEPGESRELLPWGQREAAKRKRILDEMTALKVRWETAKNDYTFLDGTTLPPRKVIHYRRDVWRPNVTELNAECAIERRNASWVEVSLRESFGPGKPERGSSFRAFRVSRPNEALAQFTRRPDPRNKLVAEPNLAQERSWRSFSYDVVELNEGEEIQIELRLDDRVILSPKFKP